MSVSSARRKNIPLLSAMLQFNHEDCRVRHALHIVAFVNTLRDDRAAMRYSSIASGVVRGGIDFDSVQRKGFRGFSEAHLRTEPIARLYLSTDLKLNT